MRPQPMDDSVNPAGKLIFTSGVQSGLKLMRKISRGASSFSEPPSPHSGQALNPDIRAEHDRSTLMYWIMFLEAFGQILVVVVHQNS